MSIEKVLQKGTKVIIVNDVRSSGLGSATGQIATFIGMSRGSSWNLFDADGSLKRESYKLPDGYVVWERDQEQKFPGVKCGIRAQNPRFRLPDGSIITGAECYWLPKNRRVREKLMEKETRELKSLKRSVKREQKKRRLTRVSIQSRSEGSKMSDLIITGKREIFRGRFVKLWGTDFLDKNGGKQLWEWIEKAQAVLIFPITRTGNVVLIKNFRVPLEKYVIEIPAGLKDKPGEETEHVARRELLEETGFTAEKFIPMPSWPYRAGSSNGIIHAFIAIEATKVMEPATDVTEDITVLEVPLSSLTKFYFSLPSDVLFQPEILALHEMAKHRLLTPGSSWITP